jgi:aspartyl protease family protein
MLKSGPFSCLTLALLFMASPGFPGLHAAQNGQPIQLMAMTELKAGNQGHYVVTARINKSNIEVLVDTGASVVALSYEDAQNAGLHPNTLKFDVPVSTANGTANAARAKLDRVEVDNVRVDNVDALVLPQGALNGTLLGMSFLAKLSSWKSENGILTLKN